MSPAAAPAPATAAASPRAQPGPPGATGPQGHAANLEGLSLRLLGPLARSPRMDGNGTPPSEGEVRLTGPIPEDRFDDVISHLRGSFFADEPLNRSVRLCERGQAHRELEEHARQTLRDNLSEMALDVTTNQVVGVALNGVLWPGDLDEAQSKLSEMDDAKFRQIFGLLYSVNKQLDLFTAFNVDRIFECRILSVDHRYRGRGLARQLLQRSIQTAKAAGFQLVKEDATGLFSQRAADSMGFRTLHELPYDEYRDEAGGVAFPTEPPHKSLKIMVKELR